MKRKGKPIPGLSEPTAAQIARLSGLSVSRVYRLLSEGRTSSQIVASSQHRRDESALRDLPTVPVNGHAANGVVSLSAAQTQKEIWTGKLRELEYLERRSTLVPVSYIKFWGGNFLVGVRDEMQRVNELCDTLATESDPVRVQKILDSWIARVMDKFYKLENLWAPTPPEAV